MDQWIFVQDSLFSVFCEESLQKSSGLSVRKFHGSTCWDHFNSVIPLCRHIIEYVLPISFVQSRDPISKLSLLSAGDTAIFLVFGFDGYAIIPEGFGNMYRTFTGISIHFYFRDQGKRWRQDLEDDEWSQLSSQLFLDRRKDYVPTRIRWAKYALLDLCSNEQALELRNRHLFFLWDKAAGRRISMKNLWKKCNSFLARGRYGKEASRDSFEYNCLPRKKLSKRPRRSVRSSKMNSKPIDSLHLTNLIHSFSENILLKNTKVFIIQNKQRRKKPVMSSQTDRTAWAR